MEKIKVSQVVVVEGKYDMITLNNILNALIIPLNGFSIYSDEEKKALLKTLGDEFGIILITDSDTAGFQLRNYIQNICKTANIINVYIPNIKGKEARKKQNSKEGFLGVEGIPKNIIIDSLKNAGVGFSYKTENENPLTYTDLYNLSLSGVENAFENRKKVSNHFNLPIKLSKKAFLEVLNRMTNYEELKNILNEETAVFWDFHGTLTKPDNQWLDSSLLLIQTHYPKININEEIIEENFGGKGLPWWTYPSRDTRHLIENDGWWKSCNEEFVKNFMGCGLNKEQAEFLAPKIREYVVDINNHILYDDTIKVLTTLKQRGYKNYLLSNNFPELYEMVEEMGISHLFEGKVVSAKIGYDKPRKEIFDYAKSLAKDAKRFIMVGDNPVDDMQGGKNAGLTTIFLNERQRKNFVKDDMDYICESLTEILEVLK